jgi:(4S)-4-hydroxy-5-phosphonooxypentane-2,3-dione isomerase
MPKIAIIVEYEIADGKENELTECISEHARLTLEEEAGCLRFEIVKPIERDGTPVPDKLLLTELYESEAALAIHEKNPRMPGLRAATAPLLKSMRLTFGTVD